MDVTSLDTKAARRHPIIVVVASNVTKSRDVVKMVVQKLGMDHEDLLLLQLVAHVNYRSRQMRTDDGRCMLQCTNVLMFLIRDVATARNLIWVGINVNAS